MGINFEWTDKVDNEDIVEAAHVNALASAIISMKDRITGGVLELSETASQGVYSCNSPDYIPHAGDIVIIKFDGAFMPIENYASTIGVPVSLLMLNNDEEPYVLASIFKDTPMVPAKPSFIPFVIGLVMETTTGRFISILPDTSNAFPTIRIDTVPPTNTDSISSGCFPGSFWLYINNEVYEEEISTPIYTIYICVNATDDTDAVWTQVGGSCFEPILYDNLVAKITAGSLATGTFYCIYDFHTVHKIFTAAETYAPIADIHIGETEPLIVQAVSPSRLSTEAYSLLYPKDILHYEPLFTDELAKDWCFSDKTDFSTPGVMLTGFKGAITFRHDTVNNITCYFDFRNCVQRRWQADVATFNSGTTYSQGDYVFYNGSLYYAATDPITNTTPNSNAAWTEILYSLNKCFLPVSEGYEWYGIAATNTYTDYPIFDFSSDYVVSNIHIAKNFNAEAAAAVFRGACTDIEVGTFGMFNWFENASNIKLGANSYNNIIYGSQSITAVEFYENLVGPYSNYNHFMSETYENVIGSEFKENVVHGAFNNNSISSKCMQNTFLGEFNYCTVGKSFQRNTIQAGVSEDWGGLLLDAVEPLHDYYNVNLFQNSEGDVCISYVDASDQFIVYNITDAS